MYFLYCIKYILNGGHTERYYYVYRAYRFIFGIMLPGIKCALYLLPNHFGEGLDRLQCLSSEC